MNQCKRIISSSNDEVDNLGTTIIYLCFFRCKVIEFGKWSTKNDAFSSITPSVLSLFSSLSVFFLLWSHLFLLHLDYEHDISILSRSFYFLLWYDVLILGLRCFCQIYPTTIIMHILEFLILLRKQKWQILCLEQTHRTERKVAK